LLYQHIAECVDRYSEDNVVLSELSSKVRLREDATRHATLNREQIAFGFVWDGVRGQTRSASCWLFSAWTWVSPRDDIGAHSAWQQ
jgi:hypothetical protein